MHIIIFTCVTLTEMAHIHIILHQNQFFYLYFLAFWLSIQKIFKFSRLLFIRIVRMRITQNPI